MPYIFGKLWHLAIIWAIRKAFQCILQGVRFLLANQTRLSPTSDNDSYAQVCNSLVVNCPGSMGTSRGFHWVMGGRQVRPREQGRRLGGHRGRQQCPRGSRWGVGVPRGQGVKGEVRGVPWGQEGGPWGHRDCRTIWHRTIWHRTIWHQELKNRQFGTRKIWHKDNLDLDNLAPGQFGTG